MPSYRIYTIHDATTIKRPPIIVDAGSDDEAIQYAKQLLDGDLLEVWDLARCVIRLEPKL
jgi:hypothetical protein